MSSDIEQKKEQMKRLVSLLTEYADASPILPEKFASLLPSIKKNITKLSTAQAEFKDNLDQDIHKDDPTLARKRINIQDRIGEVELFFDNELPPKLNGFYKYLSLEQPNDQHWAERLIQITGPLEETPIVYTASNRNVSGNVGQAKSDEGDQVSQRQYMGEAAGKSSVITISQEQFSRLKNHQRVLNDYVYEYTNLRQQIIKCHEAKFLLVEGRHKDSMQVIYSNEHWTKISNLLHQVSMLMKQIPESLISSGEFGDLIQKCDDGLRESWQSVEKVAANPEDVTYSIIQNAIGQAISHLEPTTSTLDMLADKCKEGARDELSQLDALLTNIFDEFSVPRRETEQRIKTEGRRTAPLQVEPSTASKKIGQISRSTQQTYTKGEVNP